MLFTSVFRLEKRKKVRKEIRDEISKVHQNIFLSYKMKVILPFSKMEIRWGWGKGRAGRNFSQRVATLVSHRCSLW